MDDRLPGVRMVALTDVRTQLDEAPALFGPQKGADVTQVELLRRGFARFGVQAGLQFGRDIRSAPGSGAAGGLGAAVQVLGADVVEGAQFVMTMQNLRESIAQADLVITGEGSFDRQSRAGKGTGAVLAAASDAKIPAAVVAARADSPAARPRGTFLGVFGAVPDGKRMDGRAIQAATREAVLASLRKRPSRASSPASAPVPSTPSEPAPPPRG
jgi:glycerate kinase